MVEKIYEARCNIPHASGNPVTKKTGHQSMGDAQMAAIKMSEEHGYAGAAEIIIKRVGETDVEEVGKQHIYIEGHEVDPSAADFKEKKDAAIQAATKRNKATKQKETSMETTTTSASAKAPKAPVKAKAKTSANRSLEPKSANGKGKVAGKAAAKPSKAPAKGAGKAAKVPSKPKTAKPVLAVVGDPGSLLAKFGAKEGTFKAKLCTYLVANKGSMMPLAKAVAATYGSAKPETYSPMQMTINGVRSALVANDIAWHVERAKDDKGNATIGLKAGASE